jgi:hypothetical protein
MGKDKAVATCMNKLYKLTTPTATVLGKESITLYIAQER